MMRLKPTRLLLALCAALSSPFLGSACRASAAEPDWQWSPALALGKRISKVAWSPDGSTLATSDGSRIYLHDAKTGNLLHSLTLPRISIQSPLAFSGDGKRLFAHASNFHKTMVWDVATGELVRLTANFRNGVRAGVLNHDGTIAVLAGSTGEGFGQTSTNRGAVHIWNVTTGEMTKTIPLARAGTTSVATNANATRAVVGMLDGNIAILDVGEGKVLKTIKAHGEEVRCVSMSKDGMTVMTNSRENGIHVWNAETGEKIHTLLDGASLLSDVLQASDDGKVIVTGSSVTLSVCVWDGTTGKLTRKQSFQGFAGGSALSPDASKFALATEAEGLGVYDVKTGEREKTGFGRISTPLSVSWHPKGRAVVIGCAQASPLLFPLEAEAKVQTIGNAEPCRTIGWDREGKHIYMAAEGRNVAIYDTDKPEKPRTFAAENFSSSGASMASDGKLAIASKDRFITLWDTVKNEKLKPLEIGMFPESVYFSPDGTKLMALSRDELTIFDAAKWDRLFGLKGYASPPMGATWSPDGSKIASCYGPFDDGFLYLWDAKTGKRLRTIEVPTGEATAVAWSPDSTLVVSGAVDGSIAIWEADSRKEVAAWKAHSREVSQLAWSPNAQWIASVSADGSSRIWNAKTGNEVCTLVISDNSKEWLIFTPDGRCEGTAKAAKQHLYRKNGSGELILPERYLLKQTPDLLSKVLAPWPKGPPEVNDPPKKQFGALETDTSDPAYDYVQTKNNQRAYVNTLITKGVAKQAIELSEKQFKRMKDRGLYGEMFTLNQVQDLAQLYVAAGEGKKAVAAFQEYFEWSRKVYGPLADDTKYARGLAVKSHFDIKDFDKGLAEFKAAFPARKSLSPGEQHVSYEISYILFQAKEYDKQFEVIIHSLDPLAPVQELDPKQPVRYSRYAGFASGWNQAGRKDLTEKLIEYEWQALRKANGEEDPKTVSALKAASEEYFTVRMLEKVISLDSELLKVMTKKYGAAHIETLTVKNMLGYAYSESNAPEKAIPLLKEVHQAVKGQEGAEKLYSLAVYNLAMALESAGKLSDGEAYLREYLEVERKNAKSEDTTTVTSAMASIGLNLLKQKKWEEAEKLLRETLEIRRKKEAQLWNTNNTESLLGEALLGQKKYKDAEPLLIAGYNGLNQKRVFVPYQLQAQRITEATERLVKLYEATEQPEKAEQYRKFLPKK